MVVCFSFLFRRRLVPFYISSIGSLPETLLVTASLHPPLYD
jgi:hypothetical protein